MNGVMCEGLETVISGENHRSFKRVTEKLDHIKLNQMHLATSCY